MLATLNSPVSPARGFFFDALLLEPSCKNNNIGPRKRGAPVAAIIPFLRREAQAELFDDAATRIMGEAFDAACQQLGAISDGEREAVASRIILAAKHGERDVDRLRDTGIEAVRKQRM